MPGRIRFVGLCLCKAHDFGHPGERAFLDCGFGDELSGEDPLGAFRKFALLRCCKARGKFVSSDLAQRLEDHLLRHAVEVIGCAWPPPGRHVDTDERAEVILERDRALTRGIEAGFERTGDDVPEPGGAGFFAEAAEAVETLA